MTSDMWKVWPKGPDHMEEDYPNEIKRPNCQENHPSFSKSCDIYKREMEIVETSIKEI